MSLIPRFDSRALYHALDAQRRSRRVTWADVARETGVSASTLQRTRLGGRLEVDGMLAMVKWLGVPVETFVRQVPRGSRLASLVYPAKAGHHRNRL